MASAKSLPQAPAPTPLMDKIGVYFRDKSGTCIVFSFGRKYIHAVALDGSISCVEIPRDAQMRPVLLMGQTYPIQSAAQRYLNSGLPITEKATQILRNIVNSEPITAEPEAA